MSVERAILFGCLALSGCGSLAGGNYFGEPLFEIQGNVQSDFDLQYDGDVGVALLWSNTDVLDASAQAVLVETQFPARYTLKIFQPPPAASTVQVVGGQVLEASVGQILLFEDLNGNGVWDGGEENRIGGAYNAAVLFVPDESLPYTPVEDEDVGLAPGDGTDEEPPVSPPEEPLWVPSGGFHLIEVAPGEHCQLDWESWMREADADQATLYVGYYSLDQDWDCDDECEFCEDDNLAPPTASDPNFFDDECPPTEVLLDQCDFVRESLDQFVMQDFTDPGQQDWVGGIMLEFQECFEMVCPDVLAEALEYLTLTSDVTVHADSLAGFSYRIEPFEPGTFAAELQAFGIPSEPWLTVESGNPGWLEMITGIGVQGVQDQCVETRRSTVLFDDPGFFGLQVRVGFHDAVVDMEYSGTFSPDGTLMVGELYGWVETSALSEFADATGDTSEICDLAQGFDAFCSPCLDGNPDELCIELYIPEVVAVQHDAWLDEVTNTVDCNAP